MVASFQVGDDATCSACGCGPNIGRLPCNLVNTNVCLLFASTCPRLNGLKRMMTFVGASECWWSGDGDPNNLTTYTDGGCTFGMQSVNFFCGCSTTGICLPAELFGTSCAAVGANGSNNCPTSFSGGAWKLVNVPGGIEGRLQVRWISAAPPIGIAHGFVAHESNVLPGCTCPCAEGTRVDILVTMGACP